MPRVIMRSGSPVSTWLPEPCGPRSGCCRSRCQAHGWCRHSGPGWERSAPAICPCPLGEPKPGRRQAVKAEAAKRGRDSASLYGLRPVRFTAISSKRTCRRAVWKAGNHRPHRTSSNSRFGRHRDWIGDPAVDVGFMPAAPVGADFELSRERALGDLAVDGGPGQRRSWRGRFSNG